MKKTSKRIISIFLSALMIITTMPFTAITAEASTETTLFDYDFTNDHYDGTQNAGNSSVTNGGINKDSVNTADAYGIGLMIDWSWDAGDHYKSNTNKGSFVDRYWFKDGWMSGKVNPLISSSPYNTNWKITLDFKINKNQGTNNGRYLIGLSSSETVSTSNSAFFGVSNTGNLVYNGSVVQSNVLGTTVTDSSDHSLTYAYNSGSLKIYYDGTLKYTYDATTNATYQGILENIKSVAIGGCSNQGNGLDVYSLKATSSKATPGDAIVSTYLTDSLKDGFTGTATWDSTMEAWSFDGSKYIKLDDTPFSDSSVSNGFAVSFDVYHNTLNATNTDYFYFTDGGSNHYYMNADDVTWYYRYRTAFDNSSNTRGYFTSDFNSSYCDYYVRTNGNAGYMNDMVEAGKWYTYTIAMSSSGALSYYIDGVLKATYKTNYGTLGNGNGVSDSDVTNIIQSLTDYYIGASNTSGSNGFNGYIKNLKFFNKDVISSIPSNTTIEDAISIYEAKMGIAIYENMGTAYKAYIDACEALDASTYGADSAKLETARTNLVSAINGMTVWKGNTITSVIPTYANNSQKEEGGHTMEQFRGVYYDSLLYSPQASSTQTLKTDNGNIQMYMYYPTTVMAYKQDQLMAMPIYYIVYRSGGGDRYVYNVYPTNGTSSGGSAPDNANAYVSMINSRWHTNWTSYWDYNWQYLIDEWDSVGATKDNTSSPTTYYFGSIGKGDQYRFANALKINETTIKAQLNSSGNGGVGYADFQLYWQLLAGSQTNQTYYNDIVHHGQASDHIYVIDYQKLVDAAGKNVVDKLGSIDVANYKEGGLTSLMTAFDNAQSFSLTDYNFSTNTASTVATVATDISTRVTDMNDAAVGSEDTLEFYYYKLRTALSLNRTIENAGTYTVVQAYQNGTDAVGFEGYSDFASAYVTARNLMAALDNVDNTSGYTLSAISSAYGSTVTTDTLTTAASTLTTKFNELTKSAVEPATFTGVSYLGPADAITVTDTNSGKATYTWEYSTDGGSSYTNVGSVAVAANSTGTFIPFSTSAMQSLGTVKIRIKSTLTSTGTTVYSVGQDYTYLVAPSFNKSDNDIIGASGTVTITNVNAVGTVQYSYDNFTNTSNGSSVTPFTDNSSEFIVTLYARVVYNGSTSNVTQVTLLREENFGLYFTGTDSSGSSYSSSRYYYPTAGSLIKLADAQGDTTPGTKPTTYSGKNVYYTVIADGTMLTNGGGSTHFNTYAINNGISTSAFSTYTAVTITMFAREAEDEGYDKVAEHTFINKAKVDAESITQGDAQFLVYQESFDGTNAYASGTTFDKGNNSKGLNGTIANSGTVSIVDTIGADYDKRNKVLKIAADTNYSSSSSRGNYLQFASNPLSSAATAQLAQANGITISFWRYVYNTDNNAVNHYDSTTPSQVWHNAVNFTQYDTSNTDKIYRFSTLTATGRLSFSEYNTSKTEGGHFDYFPNDTDITNHSTSVTDGYWTNIVLTVDPNASSLDDAVIIYINGEPHNIGALNGSELNNTYNAWRQQGGSFSGYSYKQLVDEILKFYTDEDTHFDLAYSAYNESDRGNKDLYLDDIRIYTTVKTQVDINNMYTDSLTDAKKAGVDYKSSTSHDPMNVTVYTFKE